MAAKNYERILIEIFGHEGSFGADPKDKGNWSGGQVGVGVLKGTKFGISAAAYPGLDIKSLTVSDAATIYRLDYWDVIGGDKLYTGVDLTVMDCAVNSGPGTAKRLYALSWKTDRIEVIDEFNARRLGLLHSLKTWARYGKGWARRVANVHATSLAWAWLEAGLSRDQIAKLLRERALDMNVKADRNGTKAGTAAGGGAVAAPASYDLTSPWGKAFCALVVLAGIAVAVILIHKRHQQKLQAAALATHAGKWAL
jgi:lysozyme family protein